MATVVSAPISTDNRGIIASVHYWLRAIHSRPKGGHPIVTRYSRQDVLRILKISPRQLLGWERAGLISSTELYGFPELTQLRILRELQHMRMSPRSIRNSVEAMQAVSGLCNPLLESTVVRTGARLVFRHSGTMVDPIRRQLLFDFESSAAVGSGRRSVTVSMLPPARTSGGRNLELQSLFLSAVQAEEQGRKPAAMEIYDRILAVDPAYTAALINLGTLHYHQKQYQRAEELYRRATEADPSYVLAFFDLGNVLDELDRSDESIATYRQAIALAPGYADAHYNLALACERKGERRRALTHWQIYVRLDKRGPWADHARGQIRKLLSREKLAIAHRTPSFRPQPRKSVSLLELVAPSPASA
jgi:tetratricopeptide (TPR) repeat protein